MKRLIMFVIAFCLLSGSAWAMDVTFAWDANSDADLAGYRLHQSLTAGGPYTVAATIPLNAPGFVPSKPEWTIKNLVRGTRYYFVATAFDNEVPPLSSTYSNEVTTNGGPQSPSGMRIKVIVEVSQIP